VSVVPTDPVAEGARFYADELRDLGQSEVLAELRDTTVVLIGASGLLGTAALHALTHIQKCRAIGVSRREWTPPEHVRHVAGSATDPLTYSQLPAADYVVYIAGNTSDAGARPWETVDVTLNGLALALAYAERSNCRGLVFISSTRVYGTHQDRTALTEDSPAQCEVMSVANIYDCSKRLAESLLYVAHQRQGLPTCVIRLANTYGPFSSNPAGHFVGDIVKTLATTHKIDLRGHPDSIRNYCFVTDAAKGLLFALARGRRGTAYNIGSDEHRSNFDFIRQLADLLPFDAQVNVPPAALLAPRSEARVSIDKARRELAYTPRGTLARCLPFVVDWTVRALGT